MNMLASLTTSNDIGGEEKDSLGGGRQLFETGTYKFKIAMAYVMKSEGGAVGLSLTLKTEDDRELRQVMWMTNKQGQNFYEKNGEKNYLPGFNMANSLVQLTTGKEVSQMEPEEKFVNIYDFKAKAEVPTKVQVLTELLNQDIYAGVFKQIVDKTAKNEATGKYEPTGETREENEIDKFFCARDGFDKLTSAEIRAKRAGQDIATDNSFFVQWGAKNAGKVRDKSTKDAAKSGTPGSAPKAAGPAAGTKPTNSLFG